VPPLAEPQPQEPLLLAEPLLLVALQPQVLQPQVLLLAEPPPLLVVEHLLEICLNLLHETTL
jgi:hypothetical protein